MKFLMNDIVAQLQVVTEKLDSNEFDLLEEDKKIINGILVMAKLNQYDIVEVDGIKFIFKQELGCIIIEPKERLIKVQFSSLSDHNQEILEGNLDDNEFILKVYELLE